MGTLREDQYTIFCISPNSSQNKKCFRQKFQRKPKHTFYAQKLFSENRTVYGIMWKNTVQPDRRQMTIWRMYISCWEPKVTDIHLQYTYVKHTDFPLQKWLNERATVLRYMYIACLVHYHHSTCTESFPY